MTGARNGTTTPGVKVGAKARSAGCAMVGCVPWKVVTVCRCFIGPIDSMTNSDSMSLSFESLENGHSWNSMTQCVICHSLGRAASVTDN